MTAYTLRRLTSSPRNGAATLHVIGLLRFAASFAWLPNITNPLHQGFGGSYKFLTILALTLSTITFAVALLADLLFSRQLIALKNLLSVCATPLDLLISILYWSLHAIDKRIVVPPGHELPFIPDFGLHAVPAIMLTLDLMILSPPWSIKAYDAMTLGSLLILLYWAWIEYCFSLNGWYPYPLLGRLSTLQKLLLCIVSAALMTGSTMALKWVYRRVNRVEGPSSDTSISIKMD